MSYKLHLADKVDPSVIACGVMSKAVVDLIPMGVEAPPELICQRCVEKRKDIAHLVLPC